MAEEQQGVRNKGLLLAALALGVVVVIVFNVFIQRARSIARGAMVEVLYFNSDMQIGDEIEDNDMSTREIEQDTFNAIGGLARAKDKGSFSHQLVSQPIRRGQFVSWAHIGGSSAASPASNVTPGLRGHTVLIDSSTSPGTMLRAGDRIDLIGIFEVEPGRPRAYTVLRNVKVLAIGGQAPTDPSRFSSQRAPRESRAYRSIALDVSPDVALGLTNLGTKVLGSYTVDVRNPSDLAGGGGTIRPPLDEFAEQASVARSTTAGGR